VVGFNSFAKANIGRRLQIKTVTSILMPSLTLHKLQ